MEDAAGTCGHRCPQHPDWTPCRLSPGHTLVIGHRDSAGPDVTHVWQDSGHGGPADQPPPSMELPKFQGHTSVSPR